MAPARYVAVVRVPPDIPLAIMDLAIGLLYVLQPGPRTTAPALSVARSLLPIHYWGVVFITLAVVLGTAVWGVRAGASSAARVTSWVVQVGGSALFIMWALMYFLAAIEEPKASLVGIPTFLYLGYRHTFAPARPAGG